MGDEEGGDKSRRVVFVTVGTTSFDALVRAVDSENVKKELLVKGYTHLLIQMGRGSYVPTKVVSNIIPAIPPFSFLSSVFQVSEIISGMLILYPFFLICNMHSNFVFFLSMHSILYLFFLVSPI
jgi:hypothetical protein